MDKYVISEVLLQNIWSNLIESWDRTDWPSPFPIFSAELLGLFAKSLGDRENFPKNPDSDVGLKFADVDCCSSDSELSDVVKNEPAEVD